MQQLPPDFALLVPCYNAAAYIDLFLENISRLTTPFDQVIFYDDASTDNTLMLLQSKGLNVIAGQANQGPGFARNQLAQATTCRYIHFHDIDDEFAPDFLTLIKQKFTDTDADVVLGYADWLDIWSRNLLIRWLYDEYEIKVDPLTYFITHPLGIINVVYSRDAFNAAGGFNTDINCWEDADLHVKLAANKACFAVINEVIAYSLRHDKGISNNQTRCWNCRLTFLEQYLEKYAQAVDRKVFEQEIEKVKRAFLAMAAYSSFARLTGTVKRYSLNVPTGIITTLYYVDKILPQVTLNKIRDAYFKFRRRRFTK